MIRIQSTILVMLPPWAVFRYLSPSLCRFCLYDISTFNISTNGKDVLKQPEANTDLLYFSALSYYKCSVEKKIPYICYRIRIIVLTCPDNKSARNQPKQCVPVMQNHTNHNDMRSMLVQLKSSFPFSLFLFVWRLESTTTKSLLRHLHSPLSHGSHIGYDVCTLGMKSRRCVSNLRFAANHAKQRQARIQGRWNGWIFTPLFLSALLSFFSLPSNIDWFSCIITKIHPPFQNPGSAPERPFQFALMCPCAQITDQKVH